MAAPRHDLAVALNGDALALQSKLMHEVGDGDAIVAAMGRAVEDDRQHSENRSGNNKYSSTLCRARRVSTLREKTRDRVEDLGWTLERGEMPTVMEDDEVRSEQGVGNLLGAVQRNEVVIAMNDQCRYLQLAQPRGKLVPGRQGCLRVEPILDDSRLQDVFWQEMHAQPANDGLDLIRPKKSVPEVCAILFSLGLDVAAIVLGRARDRAYRREHGCLPSLPLLAKALTIGVRSRSRIQKDQMRDAVGVARRIRQREEATPRMPQQRDRIESELLPQLVEVV
jgi:hypothetical protein